MPQEIYNEGRVVGLSAWELFKRQALSNGVPENKVPNELEWISSMVGAGASMILKIDNTNGGYNAGIHDYELPSGSNLTAAGLIIASPFMGTCEFDEHIGTSSWAKKVTSYGSLIENDSSKSPTALDVPYNNTYTDYKDCVTEFLKITDGVVFLKNANWIKRKEPRSEIFTGTGSQTTFTLNTQETVLDITKVTVRGEEVVFTYDGTTKTITISEAPPEAAPVVINYDVLNSAPDEDVDPNFNESSTVIRLYFKSELKHDVYILFTGFTNKRVLQGLSGYAHDVGGYALGGSTDMENNHWENGGLLGPEIIPWASKIVFAVSNSAFSLTNTLSRIIPKDDSEYTIPSSGLDIAGIKFYGNANNGEVKSNAVIDFNSIELTDYYAKHSYASTIKEEITDVLLDRDNVSNLVAWYPGMTATNIKAEAERVEPSAANFFPPALYAAKITQTGDKILVPLDTSAPGTIKCFANDTDAINYKSLMSENYALYYNSQKNSFSFAISGLPKTEWPGAAKISYDNAPKATILAGDKTVKVIALNDSNGNAYNTDGTSQETLVLGPEESLNWTTLLNSLIQNKKVDILGDRLRSLGKELKGPNTHTIGVGAGNNDLTNIASEKFTITGDYPVNITTSQNAYDTTTNLAALNADSAYKSGTEFIEFNNGLRLYISNTPGGPVTTNVPVGSIGIGWVVDTVSEELDLTEPGELIDEHSVPANG